ncbi:MAG: hypothetical protein ABUS79_27820, partial [Pseudomonadota bacterium]
MIADLENAGDVLAVWDSFAAAADRASDRFALLACRHPLAALRALYRQDAVSAPGAADLTERERRLSFLRTGRIRDLLRFAASTEYLRAASSVADPGADA